MFLIFDYAITPRNGYQLLQKTNLIRKLSNTGNEARFPKQASTDNVIFSVYHSLKDMLKIVSIKMSSYLHFNVLQSMNSWRNVFWLAASITMSGAITFAVLASDQLQDWAEEKKCDQGGKIERA